MAYDTRISLHAVDAAYDREDAATDCTSYLRWPQLPFREKNSSTVVAVM